MPVTRRDFAKTLALGTASFSIPGLAPGIRRFVRQKAPSDTVRFGVIGCRGMGYSNTRSLLGHEGAECVALCDVDQSVIERRTADVKELSGVTPTSYGDYRALLEHEGLDFVVIGTPDHWHPLMTLDAVDAGLHVYVEKPLANSIHEADVTKAGVEASDKLVQVGQWQRSGPHWQEAMDFVHSGQLGQIRTVKTWGLPRVDEAPYRCTRTRSHLTA